MAISKQRAAWLAAGIGWAIASGAPALADDTEIFFVDPANITTQPNILFIFDNSGSMDEQVESQTPYEPATTYPGLTVRSVEKAGRVAFATVRSCGKKKLLSCRSPIQRVSKFALSLPIT